MNGSAKRYGGEYLQTTGSYIEQGSEQDTAQAHQAARRAAFRRARRDYRVQVGVFAVVVIAFCAVLGYGVVSLVLGYGR